jgi:uncharacterized protein (TIGR02145 family)
MKQMLIVLLGIVILAMATTLIAAECGDVNNDGAINIKDITHLIKFKYKEGPPPDCGTVTDIDGNVYQTVTIGTQVWMAENLKVTRYRNGDPIPNITSNSQWASLTTGAYCEYDNDINNVATYGRLYNWEAVDDSRNIAPEGWHVPTDAEWTTLINYLGGPSVAGGKMKETGTTHWMSPNTGATNESGFTGLPGGWRYSDGNYFVLTIETAFWSSTYAGMGQAQLRDLVYSSPSVYSFSFPMSVGLSIRCVRD